MPNFLFDPVQAQDDLVGLLLSSADLVNVNVKSYRKMRLQSELDYRSLLTTPRNGRNGAALLVCQPTASGRNPNVSGPVLDWTFPVVAIEQDGLNMNPATGTLISAEDLARLAMNAVQLFADDLTGTFKIESNAIKPETTFVFPGCISYRVNFSIVGDGIQTPRCAAVQLTADAVAVTNKRVAAGASVELACATPGSTVYYTVDGTFPTNDVGGNPGSVPYAGAFAAAAGQVLRAVAYADGFNNSPARYALVQ